MIKERVTRLNLVTLGIDFGGILHSLSRPGLISVTEGQRVECVLCRCSFLSQFSFLLIEFPDSGFRRLRGGWQLYVRSATKTVEYSPAVSGCKDVELRLRSVLVV